MIIKTDTVNANNLNVEDRKTLKSAIFEISNSMLRIAAEKELQKNILTDLMNKIEFDKKIVRRMAKAYFKSSFNEEVEQNTAFEDAYTLVLGEKNEHQT